MKTANASKALKTSKASKASKASPKQTSKYSGGVSTFLETLTLVPIEEMGLRWYSAIEIPDKIMKLYENEETTEFDQEMKNIATILSFKGFEERYRLENTILLTKDEENFAQEKKLLHISTWLLPTVHSARTISGHESLKDKQAIFYRNVQGKLLEYIILKVLPHTSGYSRQSDTDRGDRPIKPNACEIFDSVMIAYIRILKVLHANGFIYNDVNPNGIMIFDDIKPDNDIIRIGKVINFEHVSKTSTLYTLDQLKTILFNYSTSNDQKLLDLQKQVFDYYWPKQKQPGQVTEKSRDFLGLGMTLGACSFCC